MEQENVSKTLFQLNAAADFVNPVTDQCSTISEVTENVHKLDLKNDAKPPKVTSKPSLKKKKLNHPPTSTMVLESIKLLKMRKGTPAKAIGEFIEGHYGVSAKQVKPYIDRFLKTGVEKGILEQVSGVGGIGRFKIKKMEQVKAAKGNVKLNQKKKASSKVTSKPSLKRKKPEHPPISTMVLEAIKSLKRRKGVPVEVIDEFIERHYGVSSKQMKLYVYRLLKTGVEKGILDQVSGDGVKGQFKIKKTEKVKEPKGNIKLNH